MLHGVVVGVGAHEDPKIHDLQFAGRDAEALATLLRARVPDTHLDVLVDDGATKHNIVHAIRDELPTRVRREDSVLLYFAGHGCPELESPSAGPSLHLVAHDTTYARLFATAINLVAELSTWVRRIAARQVTIVLDTAFSGAPGGRTFEGPGLWSGPRVRRLDRLSLHQIVPGTHCAVLAACSDKEVAREDNQLGHGVFTYHLLEILNRAALERVVLAGLHGAIAERVRQRSKGAQNPALHGNAWGPLVDARPLQPTAAPSSDRSQDIATCRRPLSWTALSTELDAPESP